MGAEAQGEPAGSLDIGSNTVRVLVVRMAGGRPVRLLDTGAFARLAEGLAETGRLSDQRMARALELVREYSEAARRSGARRLFPFCTAAVRHARNGAEFARRVSEAAGAPARVLTGQEEACWAFAGATKALSVDGEALVLDIGGGSTELVTGGRGCVRWAQSYPVGSRSLGQALPRCTGRLEESGVAQLVASAGEVLDGHAMPRSRPGDGVVIGTGGTFTVLAALAQRMAVYDAERVQGYELGWIDIREILARAASVGLEERGRWLRIDPDRADVIVPGAALALAVMERLNARTVTVDTYGVRLGALLAGVGQEVPA